MPTSAPLPPHWSRRQRLKNNLIYYTVRCLWFSLSSLPTAVQRWLCEAFAKIAYQVATKERRLASEHLAKALPDLNPTEIDSLNRQMFSHFGQSIFELLNLEDAVTECINNPENQPAFEALAESLAENAGAIVVTGHIGNWELMAQAFSYAGFPISSVAKPIYDPRLTTWVDQFRGRYGMKTLWRGQSESFKAILRVFRDQETFGILIDQDTKVPGDFVPFFGDLAFTPTAAATLHRRTGAPVLVGCHHRSPDGHRIRLTRVEPLTSTEDKDFDRAFTAQLTLQLEDSIRQEPAQWVWLHQRWKTRPVASTKDLGVT